MGSCLSIYLVLVSCSDSPHSQNTEGFKIKVSPRMIFPVSIPETLCRVVGGDELFLAQYIICVCSLELSMLYFFFLSFAFKHN